jgi:hypothetical protein
MDYNQCLRRVVYFFLFEILLFDFIFLSDMLFFFTSVSSNNDRVPAREIKISSPKSRHAVVGSIALILVSRYSV